MANHREEPPEMEVRWLRRVEGGRHRQHQDLQRQQRTQHRLFGRCGLGSVTPRCRGTSGRPPGPSFTASSGSMRSYTTPNSSQVDLLRIQRHDFAATLPVSVRECMRTSHTPFFSARRQPRRSTGFFKSGNVSPTLRLHHLGQRRSSSRMTSMLGHQTSVLKGAPSPSGRAFESVSSELFGRFAAFAVRSLCAMSLWLTVLSPLLWMLLRKPSREIGLALKATYANWTRATSARRGGAGAILSSRWLSSTRHGRGQPSSAT